MRGASLGLQINSYVVIALFIVHVSNDNLINSDCM